MVHRDLKPGNILVTAEGVPKLLDFGIAKMQIGNEVGDETDLTSSGVRPYTPNYASPEQVRGETLTPASDVYSLGAVLYELLTGQRPHRIATMTRDEIERAVCEQDTIRPSRAVRDVAGGGSTTNSTSGSTTRLSRELSGDLDNIILTAMRKDAKRRYASAADFSADLGRYLDGLPVKARGDGWLYRMFKHSRRHPVAWGLSAASVAAAVFFAYAAYWRTPEVRFDYQQITSAPGEETFPAMLPDGSGVVYASRTSGNWDLYLMRFGEATAHNLTADSTADEIQPAVSRDGRIAFRSERDGGGIFVMSMAGAGVRQVSRFGYNPAWSPDGKRIAFATESIRTPETRTQMNSHLWIAEVESGVATELKVDDGVQPAWSPDGSRLVYWNTTGGKRDIFTAPVDGKGAVVRVTDDAFIDWSPAWSPNGRHIYFASDRGGSMNIWRVRVDSAGRPLQPPQLTPAPGSFNGQISFSAKGNRFAYMQRSVTSTLYEATLENGRLNGPPRFVAERANNPDISPDGRAVVYQDNAGKQEDLLVANVDGSQSRRITNDTHRDRHPRWSPDGKRILFYSNRSGRYELWTAEASTGVLTQLTQTAGPSVLYGAWSPDGRRVVFNDLGANPPYVIDVGPDGKAGRPEMLPFWGDKSYAVTDWSRDGKWLAGFGRHLGVLAFELAAKKFVTIAAAGRDPVWFPDGAHVAYTEGSEILMGSVKGDRPVRLLDLKPNEVGRQISLSRDGKRLYYTAVVTSADIWMASEE